MRRREFLKAAAISGACLAHQANARDVASACLVQDGRPASSILLGKQASSTERYAAEELQRYLEKMSGAKIPIEVGEASQATGTMIIIGTPRSNDDVAAVTSGLELGRDGFRLEVSKDRIILAGEQPPGALYATYALLEEHIGVRWFFPGADGEHVPARRTIEIQVTADEQKPALPFRGIHVVAGNPKDPDVADWMARNRMNLRSQIVYEPRHARDALACQQRGLVFSTATHFGHWLDHGKRFATHPELFPLLDGKRSQGFPSGYAKGMLQQHNYCLSNWDLVKEVAKSIREFVKRYPQAEMIGVNQHDSQKWCECEPCQQLGTPTDMLHTFLNRLVEELGPVLDKRVLATQAYQKTEQQPTKVEPSSKVVIYYTLISHCSRHGWNENCPTQESQKQNLAAWQRHGNQVIVYTYHADMFPGFPLPLAYHVLDGVKHYNRTGIAGWYPEATNDAPGKRPLKRDPELIWGDEWYSKLLTYYTAAKALWNPETKLEDVKDDFFPKFYGAAGSAMRSYYDTLEDTWRNPGEVRYPHKRILGFNPSTAVEFLTPAIIGKINGHLAEARQLAAAEPDVIQRRVERDTSLFAKWEKRYRDTGGISTRR